MYQKGSTKTGLGEYVRSCSRPGLAFENSMALALGSRSSGILADSVVESETLHAGRCMTTRVRRATDLVYLQLGANLAGVDIRLEIQLSHRR